MEAAAKGEVVLYQLEPGLPVIEVRLENETVWLSQQQIAVLFEASRTNVVEHIKHIYDEDELDETATCRNFRQVRTEGARTVERDIPLYNLDMILSIGYRVRSRAATQFRIWATRQLRDYLVKGISLNEKRLEELGKFVEILARTDNQVVAGIADLLADYLPGLQLLRDYDEGRIDTRPVSDPTWTLTIDEAREIIARVSSDFPKDSLLGQERGSALDGIIGAVYQAFSGTDLYPSVEEKAANLLYLIVKDHPLLDGNKRCAAAIFITFLARNGLHSWRSGGGINSNALAALTLMTAVSNPREKELMISLIIRMISEGAR